MKREDLLRELHKAHEALVWAERHLMTANEANAALHCNVKVFFYSPLTTQVHNARESLERVIVDVGSVGAEEVSS